MDFHLLHVEEIDSTNRLLMRLAAEGAASGTVIMADRQSAGRGRLDHSFFSPEGGLYFSVLLRAPLNLWEPWMLTTSAAVCMARAIEKTFPAEISSDSVRIKWVNDLYLRDRKVCGILTEAQFLANHACYVVGIGVNIATSDFPSKLIGKAGTLLPGWNGDADALVALKNALLTNFLDEFEEQTALLPKTEFLADYSRRSYLSGKTVSFERDGKAISAKVIGIGKKGELLLEGTEPLAFGEVSVKTE